MKWNVQFRIVNTAGRERWAPNHPNPIDCDSLRSALEVLLDSDFVEKAEGGLTAGIKCVGIHLCNEDHDSEFLS